MKDYGLTYEQKNTFLKMIDDGWKYEGLAFKYDDQKPITREIAPWRTICVTKREGPDNIVNVWSKDELKDGLQK